VILHLCWLQSRRKVIMQTMTDRNLDEIFDAFIHAGLTPSDDLFGALAEATESTTSTLKKHYANRYRDKNETYDDPFSMLSA
jgi:hypothetical protein